MDKVPYYPKAGARHGISTAKPKTWGSFDEAVYSLAADAWFDGIGRLVGEGDVLVDLDKCIENGKIISLDAAGLVQEFDTYTELSPSGSGLRIFGLGRLLGPEATDHDLGVEIYGEHDKRFLKITGVVLNEARAVRRLPQSLTEDVYRRFKKVTPEVKTRPLPALVDPDTLPDLNLVGLMPQQLLWMLNGFDCDLDRSKEVQVVAKDLVSRGLELEQVFTILCENHSWDVALDHRG